MLIEADILEPSMESNTLSGIAKPFHNFTTAVDFPAALALFWFSGEVNWAIRAEAPAVPKVQKQ